LQWGYVIVQTLALKLTKKRRKEANIVEFTQKKKKTKQKTKNKNFQKFPNFFVKIWRNFARKNTVSFTPMCLPRGLLIIIL
jgi:hypothetical protein